MLWNLADLVATAYRRGKGIPSRVHVFADCVLVVGMAAGAGLVIVDLFAWYG